MQPLDSSSSHDLTRSEAQVALIAGFLVALGGAVVAALLFRLVQGSWSGKGAPRGRRWAGYGVALGTIGPAGDILQGMFLSQSAKVAIGFIALLIFAPLFGAIGLASGKLADRSKRPPSRRTALDFAGEPAPEIDRTAQRTADRREEASDAVRLLSARSLLGAMPVVTDAAFRRILVVVMICIAAGALAAAWSANYHVVSGGGGYAAYIVNTLTGSRTFCNPSGCRRLTPQ